MRRALTAAVAVATVLAVPAQGKACAAVRRSGPLTISEVPGPENVAGQPIQLHSGQVRVTAGGAATLASYYEHVSRSDDGLCTWRTAFSQDPRGASSPWAYDTDYVIRSVATSGDARRMYVLLGVNETGYWDPFVNIAGGSLYPLATSTDGGATWQAAPVATATGPVLGDGAIAAVAVAPSNPSVAYVHLGARNLADPQSGIGMLYVTRDGGTTWTYVAPHAGTGPITVDAADPNVLYVAERNRVDMLTVGATVTRKVVVTAFEADATVEGFDVIHARGAKARLLATVSYVQPHWTGRFYAAYRSLDGGAHWSHLTVPLGMANESPGAFQGGGLRFTGSGDLVGMTLGVELARQTTWLYRYDAKRHAWRKRAVVSPPLLPGFQRVLVSWFAPGDATRTVFLYGGQETFDGAGAGEPRLVAGTYDTRL